MNLNSPDADGWYRDRPVRDLKEWKEWQKIWSTKYDFSKPVTIKQRVKTRSKSRYNQLYHHNKLPDDKQESTTATHKVNSRKKTPERSHQDKRCDSEIQVFVRTPLSTIESFNVKQSYSVLDIKQLLSDKLGIATGKQELYTGHLQMCNLLSLGDHGIKDQSNMEMKIVPGLLGGADKPPEGSSDNRRKKGRSCAAKVSPQPVDYTEHDRKGDKSKFSATQTSSQHVHSLDKSNPGTSAAEAFQSKASNKSSVVGRTSPQPGEFSLDKRKYIKCESTGTAPTPLQHTDLIDSIDKADKSDSNTDAIQTSSQQSPDNTHESDIPDVSSVVPDFLQPDHSLFEKGIPDKFQSSGVSQTLPLQHSSDSTGEGVNIHTACSVQHQPQMQGFSSKRSNSAVSGAQLPASHEQKNSQLDGIPQPNKIPKLTCNFPELLPISSSERYRHSEHSISCSCPHSSSQQADDSSAVTGANLTNTGNQINTENMMIVGGDHVNIDTQVNNYYTSHEHIGQKTFDAQTCRNQLMAEYRQTRSKLSLLPGMPEECADMDDLYVELELIKEEKKTIEIEKTKLSSQEDLLTLKNKRGNSVKRILVRGGPGTGKSSTISKLAFDWASEAPAYTQFQMLFALDLRDIHSGMNLIDAIQDQLLPKISKEELMSYIEVHAKSVVFLLDGFDEASSMKGSDIKHLLSSKWLQESLVIVTTRPHKVADFVTSYGVFLHVELTGFSKKHMKEYALRFFRVQSYSQYEVKDVDSFFQKLETSFENLSQTPIILSMLCLLWSEDQKVLNQKVSDLYKDVVMHLAKHKHEKYNKGEQNEFLQQQLDKILVKIGKVALGGLFEEKLIFHSNEFDKGILEDACHFGLLSKESKRSKLRPIDHVAFFHKTFQEYCAAFYWASLFESDQEHFLTYLQQVHTGNVSDMEKLLQFCCGTNINAADKILPHVVRLSCDMILLKPPRDMSETVTHDSRWDLPLALFHEAGVQQMHTHLLPLFDWQTLFQTSQLDISYSVNFERLNALNFFLDCVLDNTTSLSRIYIGVNTVSCESIYTNEMLVYLKQLSCISELTTLILELVDNDIIGELINHDMSSKKQIISLQVGEIVGDKIGNGCEPKTIINFLNQLTCLTTFKLYNIALVNVTATQILDAISHYKLLELAIKGHRLCTYSLHQFIPTLERLEIDLCEDSKTSSTGLGQRKLEPQTCDGNHDFFVCTCQCECDSQCDSRKLFSAFVEIGSKLSETTSNTLVNKDVSVTGMAQPVLPCKSLILYWVEISNQTVGHFVEAFKYLGNLVELGLHELIVSDAASFQIIMSIIPTLFRIESLDLSYNNRNVGMLISRNLCYLSKLKSLKLSDTTFGNKNDMCHGLRHLQNLTHLCLQFTGLNEGMSEFGLSLNYMPDLQVLDLSWNHIGSGMVDLCHGLKHLTKLKELDLQMNKITDEGITMLPLEQLTDLRKLRICYCSYGAQGVEHLFRNLHHVRKLEKLEVKYQEDWHEKNEFLRECYQACSLSTFVWGARLNIQCHTIVHSIVLFVEKRVNKGKMFHVSSHAGLHIYPAGYF